MVLVELAVAVVVETVAAVGDHALSQLNYSQLLHLSVDHLNLGDQTLTKLTKVNVVILQGTAVTDQGIIGLHQAPIMAMALIDNPQLTPKALTKLPLTLRYLKTDLPIDNKTSQTYPNLQSKP